MLPDAAWSPPGPPVRTRGGADIIPRRRVRAVSAGAPDVLLSQSRYLHRQADATKAHCSKSFETQKEVSSSAMFLGGGGDILDEFRRMERAMTRGAMDPRRTSGGAALASRPAGTDNNNSNSSSEVRYSSSSYTYSYRSGGSDAGGDANTTPAQHFEYTAQSRGVHDGRHAVTETKRSYRDSTGRERHGVARTVGDRGRRVTRERDGASGEQRCEDRLLATEDGDGFDRDWSGRGGGGAADEPATLPFARRAGIGADIRRIPVRADSRSVDTRRRTGSGADGRRQAHRVRREGDARGAHPRARGRSPTHGRTLNDLLVKSETR